MTLLLTATLLISGLFSLSSSVPHQFHVVKEQKSWPEAQQYCREKFTDLATIDNMTEMESLKSLMDEAGVTHAWIGLKKGSSPKWHWSLADDEFYRENETEFSNWYPKGPAADKNCVSLNEAGGQWHAYNCELITGAICYDGENSTHPYQLVTQRMNWRDAQRYCREKYTDLASVRNQVNKDQIETCRRGTYAWIGLFRDAWEWSDGSHSSFRHWNNGDPNNVAVACTIITMNGLWNDLACHYPRNFICYGAPKKVQTVRVNFIADSPVNINNSAVQNAILKQIWQRLSESGMSEDAKLTWKRQRDGELFHEIKENKERRKKKQKMKKQRVEL